MTNKLLQFSLLCIALCFSKQILAADDGRGHHKKRPKRPAFTELDANDDGSVLLDEFKQHPIVQRSHEEIFGHIDADADGVISEQEFKSHKPPRRSKRDRSERH